MAWNPLATSQWSGHLPTLTLQPYPPFPHNPVSLRAAQGVLEGVGWEGGRVGPKHPSTKQPLLDMG